MNTRAKLCMILSVFMTTGAIGSPRDEASRVLGEFVTAYNSANAEALASLFSAEPKFFGLQNRQALVSRQQIAKYFEPLPRLKYKIRFNDIAMSVPSENTVIATVIESYVARRKNTDYLIETRTSFTVVKIGQEWKIAGYHKSPQPEK